jgi:hypothetical protein
VTRLVNSPSALDRRFDFMLVNASGAISDPITSSMSVTSFDGLHDATISCLDSVGTAVSQDINIVILGGKIAQ